MSTTNFNIKYIESLEGSSYIPLAVEAWNDLLRSEYCGNTLLLKANCSAVILIDSEREVDIGIIVFTKLGEQITINMGYLRFLYRNRGLYSKLWSYLVNIIAKHNNIKTIYADAYLKNTYIHKIMKDQGRIPYLTAYRYEVK